MHNPIKFGIFFLLLLVLFLSCWFMLDQKYSDVRSVESLSEQYVPNFSYIHQTDKVECNKTTHRRFKGWELGNDMRRQVWQEVVSDPEKMDNVRRGLNNAVSIIEQQFHKKLLDQYDGTGIVLSIYPKLFNMTRASLKYLRLRLHCNLPIEIWVNGTEFQQADITALEEIGNLKVLFFSQELVDNRVVLNSLFIGNGTAKAGDIISLSPENYYFKILAILCCSFRHVLFLDSDNFALRDPTFLFETDQYLDSGLIVWPDFWKQSYYNSIWSILNIKCIDEYEVEAGQLVVDIHRHWRSLQFTLYLLLDPVINPAFLGDKDTFVRAARVYQEPYSFVPHEAVPLGKLSALNFYQGYAMLQSWFDHMPLFLHANYLKRIRAESKITVQSIKVKTMFISSLGESNFLEFNSADGTYKSSSQSPTIKNVAMLYPSLFNEALIWALRQA